MRKRFLKSGVSLLVCLALMISISAVSAFAKAAGEDTHNYQIRNGVYMGFDCASYESYDFIGKLTVDTTNFDQFEVEKFSVSYTLHGQTTDLGEYPSDSWDIRVAVRTNCQDTIRFIVTLYDKDNNSYQIESNFDMRQYLDSGIQVYEPNFSSNHEIFVNYGSYYYGTLTYTYNGYTSEPFSRPGGSGVFPLFMDDPVPGSVLEVNIHLVDQYGNSCDLIRTFIL